MLGKKRQTKSPVNEEDTEDGFEGGLKNVLYSISSVSLPAIEVAQYSQLIKLTLSLCKLFELKWLCSIDLLLVSAPSGWCGDHSCQ